MMQVFYLLIYVKKDKNIAFVFLCMVHYKYKDVRLC